MRILTDKEAKRLLAAADKITSLVEPLERRIAALEAAAGSSAQGSQQFFGLQDRVARLEKIESAARAAGAAQ